MYDLVEKAPGWLRWVLTPIASGITFIVVLFAGSIAAKIIVFISGPRGGWSENFFDYLIIPGCAAFCAIAVVQILAPKAKKGAGVVFACIWIFLAGFATFFSVLSGDWKNLLIVVSIIVGAGYAAMGTENSFA